MPEHDEMAASVLVTPSTALADATDRELAVQLQTTVHRERVTAALTGRQSAIIGSTIDCSMRISGLCASGGYEGAHLA